MTRISKKYIEIINDPSVINIELDSSMINENTKNVIIIGGRINGLFGMFDRVNNKVNIIGNYRYYKEQTRFWNNIKFFVNCIKYNVNIYCVSSDKSAYDNYKYMIGYIIEEILFKGCSKQLHKRYMKLFNGRTLSNDNDVLSFLSKLEEHNMKFDYIIQNPPYSGTTHIDFFKKGLDLLTDTGKMVIIEPAALYIDIRKYGTNKLNVISIYNPLKEQIKTHVHKVIIENYNKEFSTALDKPFSITYIDKEKEHNKILLNVFGEKKYVNSLYDCNLIGDYNMIWNILDKVMKYPYKMKDHIYNPNKTIITGNIYFCMYSNMNGNTPASCTGTSGAQYKDNFWMHHIIGDIFQTYIMQTWHYDPRNIEPCTVPFCQVNDQNKLATNLYGTKEELENWKHFIFNNKLPLFINIVLVIDQHNTSKDVLCWLVDKQYTDDEINELFHFTEEEIKFMDKIIKKYERHSPWFKRYCCGPSSVSDEEVQKFIDELENEYK